jgi:NADPH:quinone reductase-like Zn-dependent oxidoreductase
MKAAVLYEKGGAPCYDDVKEPVPTDEDDVVISVKAAAIKNIDRSIASGKHYSTEYKNSHQGKIIGSDAVGLLPDGTAVYAVGQGMVAERAIANKNRVVKIPAGLDYATAAAIPNAVMGSAMALLCRAGLQKGNTVLINGATGFTGQIAIQLARHYGAGKIIATGRNKNALEELKSLGADHVVSIQQSDEHFIQEIQQLHAAYPFDVVIDYLWGHPAEMILGVLKGKDFFTHPTNYISVGSMAGDALTLSAEILRSVDLQLSGSGLGSWTKENIGQLFKTILPDAFELAAKNKLKAGIVTMPIDKIEAVYDQAIDGGKRLVITF